MELGRPGVLSKTFLGPLWSRPFRKLEIKVAIRVEMKVEMQFRSRRRVLDFRNQRIFTRKSA
jgi:hypothetical protein